MKAVDASKYTSFSSIPSTAQLVSMDESILSENPRSVQLWCTFLQKVKFVMRLFAAEARVLFPHDIVSSMKLVRIQY